MFNIENKKYYTFKYKWDGPLNIGEERDVRLFFSPPKYTLATSTLTAQYLHLSVSGEGQYYACPTILALESFKLTSVLYLVFPEHFLPS